MEPLTVAPDPTSVSEMNRNQLYLPQEHRDKFVASVGSTGISAAFIRTKTQTEQSTYDNLLIQFKPVKYDLQWCVKVAAYIIVYRSALSTMHSKIPQLNLLAKKIAQVKEQENIPELKEKVQPLQMQLLCLNKSILRLQAMCEGEPYSRAYAFRKDYAGKLMAIVDGVTNDEANRVKKLQELMCQINIVVSEPAPECKTRQEKITKRATKQLHLQILNLFVSSAKKVITQEGSQPHTQKETLIHQAEELITSVKQQLGAIKKKDLWKANVVAVTDVEFRSLAVDDVDFRFWTHTHTFAWTRYQCGSYAQTGALGVRMEEQVAKPLLGLMKAVEERRTKFCKANVEPGNGKQTLDEELDYFQNVFSALQAKLTEQQAEIYTNPLDNLTDPLQDYCAGLQMAMLDLRSTLKVAYKLSREPALEILKAQRMLVTHLQPKSLAARPETKSLEEAFFIFEAGNQLNVARKQKDKIGNLKGLVGSYLTDLVDTLREIHAVCDPRILSLTEKEKKVWDCLVAKLPVDTLRYAGEGQDELPTTVRAYLVKRIAHYLLLPADSRHDMELEILLHVVRTTYRSLFDETMKKSAFLNAIVAYDDDYGANRQDEPLKQAREIFEFIISAGDMRNLHVYVESWQKYFEFIKEYRYSNSYHAQRDILSALMTGKLDAASRQHQYVRLYPEIRRKSQDLDVWQPEETEPFLNMIKFDAEKIDQGKKHLTLDERMHLQLQGFLTRVLAAALFARDDAEKRLAYKHIHAILEMGEYAAYREKFPTDLKQLICEAAINKLIDGAPVVGKNELELLDKGPFKYFLETKDSEFIRVEMAYFRLCEPEQTKAEIMRIYTNRFIEHKGRAAFESWFASFQNRQSYDPVSLQLFRDVTNESGKIQQPITATTREIMGEEQFKLWYERLKQHFETYRLS